MPWYVTKTTTKFIVLVTLIALIFTSSLFAQHNQMGFTNYTYDNFGFRTGTVISVYKDPKGFVWFCTLGGLDRWDGTNLRHYPYDRFNTKAMPEALHGNIIMDKAGQYWINNHSCLSMMDPKLPIDSCITRFIHSPNNPTVPPLTNLTGAKFESDDLGFIWLPWPSKNGFIKINPYNKHIDFYQIDNENNTSKLNITTVYPDSITKKMWVVSTNHGFCSISTDKQEVEYFENDITTELMCLWNEKDDILKRTSFFYSRDGFFWCLAYNKPYTIFNLKTRKAEVFNCEGNIFPDHPENESIYYYQDIRGNYWFSSADHGIFFLDMQKKHLSILTSNDKGGFALAGKMFNYITGDNEGNIWISISNGGVSQFNYNNKKNYLVFPLGSNDTTKNKKYNQSISVDDFGNEYLRTNTGFYVKSLDSSNFKQLLNASTSGYFYKAEHGVHWIVSSDGFSIIKTNPIRLEKHTVQPDPYALEMIDKSTCTFYDCVDSESVLWLSDPNTGLYKYYIDKGYVQFVNCDTSIYGGEFNTLPNMIRKDSKNNLWMRLVNGLACYNVTTKKWNRWLFDPEDSKYLAIPPIRTIMVDNKDRIWFASIEGGAVWFDGKRFHHASRNIPGIIPRCYDVIEGNNNSVWFSNNANVVNYNPESGKFKNYDCLGGAQLLTLKNDSTLILGNIEPLTYVAIEDLDKQNKNSKTIISELKIFEKDYSELLNYPHINLRYNQNYLAFKFGSLDFINSKGYHFSWKLEGADHDWVNPYDNRSFASYSTLLPGNYSFKVKSSNSYGVWDKQGAILHFTIHPPWWQTWWFRALITLLTCGILYWIYRLRTERLLAMQRIEIEKTLALEHERSRISRDMHDDLGSGLSAIHLLSNYIKENTANKFPEFSAEMDQILASSTTLNQNLREIIWTTSTKDDNLTSLVSFIKKYGHGLQGTGNTRITVEVTENHEETILSSEQRKNIFLCVKESINNALKHSHCTSILIKVEILENKNLHISISDNGKGFEVDMENPFLGNGLKNIQHRMESLGGSSEIHSSPTGTTIQLILPIH